MKLTKLFIIVTASVILMSFIVGCSNASTTTATQAFQIPDNFTAYHDENSAYSIAYPNQWEVMSESELATLYAQAKETINAIKSGLPIEKASMIFAVGLKSTEGYYPSVGIVVESAPTIIFNNGLAVQAAINGLKQLDSNYQEIGRTRMSINGKDAAIVEYKAHFSSTSPLMHNYCLICLSGKTIWSVTCTALDDDFSQFSSDYNNVLRSFQLTK
jgi:hypothetical protein